MTLSANDQDFKQNAQSDGTQKHLTKEEMRQKIKASLAAKEAPAEAKSQPQPRPEPAYATSHAPADHAPTGIPSRNHSQKEEKARQIREAISAQKAQSAPSNPYPYPPQRASRMAESSNPASAPRAARTATKPRPTPPQPLAAAKPMRNNARTWIIIGIVVAAILLLSYFSGLILYRGKFLPNTFVNDVNIAGMTTEEADNAVLQTAQEMGITFIPKDNGAPISFKGSTFGCTVSLPEGSLTEAKDESHALWFTKFFSKTSYTVKMENSYSEDDLSNLIATYDWGDTPPTDAQVVENDDGTFSIEPEKDGDTVDTKILSDYAISQMRNGINTIQMADCDCYQKAAVTAASLQDTLDLYNAIGRVDITYDMTDREEIMDPVGTEILDHTTIMDWISTDSGSISVDADKATAWVQENIADKYDTLVTGYTRTFESTMDGTIELPIGSDGIYGWKTDVTATTEALVAQIESGEPATLEPVYKVEGFRMNSNSGVTYTDDTYIEVDICNQKLWFYVNGELYLESDVVTGLASDPSRATPPGAYKVWSREKGRWLGTMEVQGYHTWVDYWMAVTYTGIGLHDLNRSAYGGDIYQTHGSHGCINLPLDVAQKIYEKVTVNTPVLIIP